MEKRFFSSESAHGNETSYGFSNDTIVFVFNSKKARDNYVNESNNLSCKAIRFNDVTKEAANYSMTQNETIKPQPFTSEYWGITDCMYYSNPDKIPGLVGEVTICSEWNDIPAERLYR